MIHYIIYLIPSMLLLRSFVATGTGNSLELLEKSSNSRARTGSGLSDFFMVGLSDRLSDILYPTFSCTIRRVVSWVFFGYFFKILHINLIPNFLFMIFIIMDEQAKSDLK